MKRNLISFFLIPISLFLLMGTTFSAPAEKTSGTINREGDERGEIKIDLGPPPANAITPIIPYEESNPEKTKRDEDHGSIAIYLQTKQSDIYGGTYTSIEGEKHFLLTEVTSELEKEIKGLSAYPDTFIIKQVQYSKKQLEAVKSQLSEVADVLDLQGARLDIENNKVLAFTTTPPSGTNNVNILKEANPDMIRWEVNKEKAKYEPLAYYLYPGEQIDPKALD